MRIQDVLKFSLELVLPERLVGALRRFALKNGHAPPADLPDGGTSKLGKAQSIIEYLDHAAFGGPSFGPQTMQLMVQAFDEIQAELPVPASNEKLREIAAAILQAAADGERDLARLKSKAGVVAFASNRTIADD